MDIACKTVVPPTSVVAACAGHFCPEVVCYGGAAATAGRRSGTADRASANTPALDVVLSHGTTLELYRVSSDDRLCLVCRADIHGRVAALSRWPSASRVVDAADGRPQLVRKDWLLAGLEGGWGGNAAVRNAGRISVAALLLEYSPRRCDWVLLRVFTFALQRTVWQSDEGMMGVAAEVGRVADGVELRDGRLVGDGLWRRAGGIGDERPLVCADGEAASAPHFDEDPDTHGAPADGTTSVIDAGSGRCAALVVPFWTRAYVLAPPILGGGDKSIAVDGAEPGGNTDQGIPPALDPHRPPFRVTEAHVGVLNPAPLFFEVDLAELLGPVRIIDAAFLPRATLPTLLVLYEQQPTWAGRVEVIGNTGAVAAIALPPVGAGAGGESPSLAWALTGLPYDCERLCLLPGDGRSGVLVLSPNVLLWVDAGGTLTAALSLNRFGDEYMLLDGLSIPGAQYGGDAAQRTDASLVCGIANARVAGPRSDRLLLVAADGTLYRLQLSAHTSPPMRLTPVFAEAHGRSGCAPKGVFALSARLLMVASHLGSSMLLRLEWTSGKRGRSGAGSKRARSTGRDESWEVDVVDRLFQLGPIIDLCAARWPAATGARPSTAELVCCVGHGNDSALAVLRHHIEPTDLQKIELAGCRRVWTLYNAEAGTRRESTEEAASTTSRYHAYMVLSLQRSTVVLDTARGFEEVPASGFVTQSATLAAGNVLAGHYLVQVCRDGAHLIDGNLERVQTYWPPSGLSAADGGDIVGATVRDPWVALWTAAGHLTVLRVQANQVWETMWETDEVSCAAVYTGRMVEDLRRLMQNGERRGRPRPEPGASESVRQWEDGQLNTLNDDSAVFTDEAAVALLEEERFLYGLDGGSAGMDDSAPPTSASRALAHMARQQMPLEALLLAGTTDGALRVHALPGGECLMQCGRLYLGAALLTDEREGETVGAMSTAADAVEKEDGIVALDASTAAAVRTDATATAVGAGSRRAHRSRHAKIADLAMHDLSARHCTCLVAVLASGEALIYHGTMFADAALRFTRIDGLTSLTQVVIPAAAAGSSSSKAGSSSRRIGAVRAETFVNIDGHSGICLTGARPLVVLADSGAPTVHPLRDRPFVSLAELHNVACRRGLVTVSADGTVRVGQWRGLEAYHSVGPFLARKVRLGHPAVEAGVRLLYEPISDTVVVVTCRPSPVTERVFRTLTEGNRYEAARKQAQQPKLSTETGNDGEVAAATAAAAGTDGGEADNTTEDAAVAVAATGAHAELEAREQRVYRGAGRRHLPLPYERYAVLLLRRDTFEVVARQELDEFEAGLSLCTAHIRRFQSAAADDNQPPRVISEHDVVVLGTTYLKGEHTSIRGRLHVFEVSRQHGHGRTLYQMQRLAASEVKGAVSAVAPLKGGYISCSAGARLEVYKLVDDDMSCVSFYPGVNLFFSHVATLKQYILASDMLHSVSFLFWRERNVSQNFLCRDDAARELVASEWLIRGTQSCVVSVDTQGNVLQLSVPSATDAESRGGQRMLLESSMHCGMRVNGVQRMRVQEEDVHVLWMGSVDGAVLLVTPVAPAVHQRLTALYARLALQPEARRYALNVRGHRAFRALTYTGGGLDRPRRTLLDADLLHHFITLDAVRRKELARELGVPVEQIFDDIAAVTDTALQCV
ncbi:hypothetical protein CDCA_CDCA06G1902 [Cyanidium caldarium]|uniref:DNA damage-binding protein 1 n=1 Tax=Cyanidium caldarium TaxID=2771 RepID=A0AAV9IU77_CYACA|nr:hypothetical protein CDCA_CDCA06G1902 [Cyanidium caldarium]